MASHQFQIAPGVQTGPVITQNHFGANVILTRDYLDANGDFDTLNANLGFGPLRFPGGGITEALGFSTLERQFDVTNPGGFGDDGTRLVTYPAFYDYISQNDQQAVIVLPTEAALDDAPFGLRATDPAGLYRTLNQFELTLSGAYGPADIHTVEIGNEYWFKDSRMTATEYGTIANDFAIGLQWVIDRHSADLPTGAAFTEPRIAVQAALGYEKIDNLEIIQQLDPDARLAIDSVIQHFYPAYFHVIDDMDKIFHRMDDFEKAGGFGPLDYLVSEWNIRVQPDSDSGLKGAAGLVEMMQTMLEEGVDIATVWGTQHMNLRSRLSELNPDATDPTGLSTSLTASGEVFRMMSHSLKGLRAISVEAPADLTDSLHLDPADRAPADADQMTVHAFGNDARTVVFLSSHSDQPIELEIDLSEVTGDFAHAWGQRLNAMDDPSTPLLDEGDPGAYRASPHLTTMQGGDFLSGGMVKVTLQPWEIVRLDFTDGMQDLVMWGDDDPTDPGADYSDVLIGARGDDLISGHLGGDRLEGGEGHDTIFGGVGNDSIVGGRGNDLLFGEAGDDTLRGNVGADTLVSHGGGNDVLIDSEGANRFLVSVDGNATVSGFTGAGGAGLSFLDAYDSAEDVLARTTVENGGLRIAHDGGTSTYLAGFGADMDALSAALVDFRADPASDGLVAALTTPEPDGTYNPEADPQIDQDPDLPTTYETADFLLTRTPAEMASFVGGLDDQALADLLSEVNPDILFYTMRPEALAAFLNALDADQLEMVLSELEPGTVGFRLLRMGSHAGDFLNDLSTEGLTAVLSDLDATDREALAARMGADEVAEVREALPSGDRDLLPEPDDDAPIPRLFELPPSDDDFPEYDPEEEEAALASSGGGCFVATAAYGDGRHPDVEYLRLVRDMVLVRSRWGRAFVNTYWIVGPWLARAVRPFPRARRAAQWLLSQLVAHLRRREVIMTHGRRPRHWRDHRV